MAAVITDIESERFHTWRRRRVRHCVPTLFQPIYVIWHLPATLRINMSGIPVSKTIMKLKIIINSSEIRFSAYIAVFTPKRQVCQQ